MIMDSLGELAIRQSLPAITGRTLATDVIDQGTIGVQIGADVYLVIQVTEAATSGGAAKAAFELVSDAQGDIATDGSATLHTGLGPVPLAQLTAGARFAVPMPPGPYEKYFGLIVNVTGAGFTGGKFTAFLTRDVAKWVAMPAAL